MAFDSTLPGPLAAPAADTSPADKARLQQAFVENYTGVWRFLRRMGVSVHSVDDAAQQVFLVALKAMPRIFHGSERAFLYATAVRVAHGTRRRVAREITGLDPELDRSRLPSAEELADQKRAREILDRLLAAMDLDTRTVFVLFEFDGFTAPEIAEVLEIPLGTAASRLRRAREQFQELVQTLSAKSR